MKIILFSPTKSVPNEIATLNCLFQEGLAIYHLKKPSYSVKKLRAYLDQIPSEFHNRIVLHSHHELIKKYHLRGIHFPAKDRQKKFKFWWKTRRVKNKYPWLTISTSYHTLRQLENYNAVYSYVFLSPIFDSITKKDYQSGFNVFSLSGILKNNHYNVVALGGVDPDKIPIVQKVGFYGCALLGCIWTNPDPLKVFNEVKVLLNKVND